MIQPLPNIWQQHVQEQKDNKGDDEVVMYGYA
jgi:hypothetical protein